VTTGAHVACLVKNGHALLVISAAALYLVTTTSCNTQTSDKHYMKESYMTKSKQFLKYLVYSGLGQRQTLYYLPET
jgi:hypothetical protein